MTRWSFASSWKQRRCAAPHSLQEHAADAQSPTGHPRPQARGPPYRLGRTHIDSSRAGPARVNPPTNSGGGTLGGRLSQEGRATSRQRHGAEATPRVKPLGGPRRRDLWVDGVLETWLPFVGVAAVMKLLSSWKRGVRFVLSWSEPGRVLKHSHTHSSTFVCIHSPQPPTDHHH